MTAASARRLVHTGSYTSDTGGEGHGLDTLWLDPSTGLLTADTGLPSVPTRGPSFLAAHPGGRVVYSTNEREDGEVSAFAVRDDGSLFALGDPVSSGGSLPCHLTVHPGGRWLLTANYGSGDIAVHRLADDGSVVELTDLRAHQGRGPAADRQEGPHAHQVVVDPAGRHVLAVDLGADTVFCSTLDEATGKLSLVTVNRLRPGTGPRHLAFSPTGETVWIAGELDATVTGYSYDPETGRLTEAGSTPSTSAVAGTCQPGGIIASPCGRYVWVTNRGPNTVTAFTVDGTKLHPSAEVPSGGDWPRALSLVAGHLLVSNQLSGTVAAFRVLTATGGLEQCGPAVSVPSVVCTLEDPRDSA
jgi:6-phosphogluconolactonase (cycloisomerase 2 family)